MTCPTLAAGEGAVEYDPFGGVWALPEARRLAGAGHRANLLSSEPKMKSRFPMRVAVKRPAPMALRIAEVVTASCSAVAASCTV
jgi:hypothetical protein